MYDKTSSYEEQVWRDGYVTGVKAAAMRVRDIQGVSGIVAARQILELLANPIDSMPGVKCAGCRDGESAHAVGCVYRYV